ncbi:enoyl-CoA hydratase-related protein [Cupriavidus basilensis]
MDYADMLREAQQATPPSIARINGTRMAGGMGLLCMTDMAVAADNVLFGLPEVKVRGVPDAGAEPAADAGATPAGARVVHQRRAVFRRRGRAPPGWSTTWPRRASWTPGPNG